MQVHVWTAHKDWRVEWLNVRIYEFTGYGRGRAYIASRWGRVVHSDDLWASS